MEASTRGDAIFSDPFNTADGGGANIGDGGRFTRFPRADLVGRDAEGRLMWASHIPPRQTGPDTNNCAACHTQPTTDGGARRRRQRDPRPRPHREPRMGALNPKGPFLSTSTIAMLVLPGLLLAWVGGIATASAQQPLAPAPPSFEGKVIVRDAAGNYVPLERPAAPAAPAFPPTPVGGDIYLRDGSETSLAINFDDGNNLVGVYNEHHHFNPDIPQSKSTDGNIFWTARSFPNGSGTFTGGPFDPWAHPGNAAGEFFSSEIRQDSGRSGNSHVIVSHSIDRGASFSLFFEQVKAVFQDRDMFDVDRTSARGGGAGATHDGKVYLSYDDYGAGNTGYVGSFLQVIDTAGNPVIEVQTSGTGSPAFQGSQMQPVAGVTDGTVYLLAAAQSGSPVGATRIAEFHVITNAGVGPNTFGKSLLSWATAGQQLGTGCRWGLNGFRIDNNGYLAIDRSSGPRRGNLYFISNRNPNPTNTALDQGDVYLSVSTDAAMTWTTAVIPTASGMTQYFPMLHVDDQGAIHVAYYQNEDDVVNASTANVYYTNSTDGGTTWTTPVQVNAAVNTLNLDNPPPDRASTEYYLVGDYAQLRASGTGDATKVYVLWSGYDKTRPGTMVGNTPERVLCTTVARCKARQGLRRRQCLHRRRLQPGDLHAQSRSLRRRCAVHRRFLRPCARLRVRDPTGARGGGLPPGRGSGQSILRPGTDSCGSTRKVCEGDDSRRGGADQQSKEADQTSTGRPECVEEGRQANRKGGAEGEDFGSLRRGAIEASAALFGKRPRNSRPA